MKLNDLRKYAPAVTLSTAFVAAGLLINSALDSKYGPPRPIGDGTLPSVPHWSLNKCRQYIDSLMPGYRDAGRHIVLPDFSERKSYWLAFGPTPKRIQDLSPLIEHLSEEDVLQADMWQSDPELIKLQHQLKESHTEPFDILPIRATILSNDHSGAIARTIRWREVEYRAWLEQPLTVHVSRTESLQDFSDLSIGSQAKNFLSYLLIDAEKLPTPERIQELAPRMRYFSDSSAIDELMRIDPTEVNEEIPRLLSRYRRMPGADLRQAAQMALSADTTMSVRNTAMYLSALSEERVELARKAKSIPTLGEALLVLGSAAVLTLWGLVTIGGASSRPQSQPQQEDPMTAYYRGQAEDYKRRWQQGGYK